MSKLSRRAPRESERGQTFPIWISSIVAALVLLWFTLDYANTIKWQVRAQNAADAAAASLLSAQTTRFNQMEMTLYSLALDEWRIRNLIDSMNMTVTGAGGCQTQAPTYTNGIYNPLSACAVAYGTLRTAFVEALARYTYETQMLQTIQQNATFAKESTEIQNVINAQNGGTLCGAPNGWDCAFTYTLVPAATLQSRAQVWTVDQYYQDVGGSFYGFIEWENGTQAVINPNFLPARLEIVACAKITPPISNFFQLHAQPFTAVGRAGATAVAATQEWIEPGSFTFPAADPKYPGQPIQPSETYGISYPNSYSTVFTGNTYSVQSDYEGVIKVAEFSAMLTWWTPLPFPPSGSYTPAANTCKSGTYGS
jgi:hypothetical protein